LKALLARSQAALAEHQAALSTSEEARRRLESIISDLRREKFSSKSERLTPDQIFRLKTSKSPRACWMPRKMIVHIDFIHSPDNVL
jgi:hypothetical protein